MRILLLADYWAGFKIAKYLKERNENIVGLGIHPNRLDKFINRGYTKKIIKTVGLTQKYIFDGDNIQANNQTLERIKKLKPDIILAIFWNFLLKPELIKIPLHGCINLHLAYLPYNRGKNPNVWSIIEGTPAGVTLHYINEDVDSGDIIAQSSIPVKSIDTGETLYNKTVFESVELFKKTWPELKNVRAKRIKQDKNKGTFHYAKDLEKLDFIKLDKKYSGRELINILRARTFSPHPSAYFMDDKGKKVYIRVHLEYDDCKKHEK